MGRLKSAKVSEVPRQFAVGDYVFAKIKGYKHWPAQVKDIIRPNNYLVTFFGSEQVGRVNAKGMELYNDETCARLNTDRQMKRADYKKAIEALENFKQNDEQIFNHQDLRESVEEEYDEESFDGESTNYTEIEAFTSSELEKMPTLRVAPMKHEGLLSVTVTSNTDETVAESTENSKVELMRAQFLLLEATHIVRKSLGIEKAGLNLDLALYKMQDMQKVIEEKGTPFILCKYPQIVETQEKLCTYSGNVELWKMGAKDVKIFNVKAEVIRQTAKVNYDIITKMFDDGNSSFEETFGGKSSEIQQIREKKELDFDAFFEAMSISDL